MRQLENLPVWNQEITKADCIIVDLDGTLCEVTNRSPYSHLGVEHDKPRMHVLYTVRALISTYSFLDVFFLTGRNEKARQGTELWIKDNLGLSSYQYELLMRPIDDRRKDSIYKKEMYETYIKPDYNVMVVFEDRPQVIRECWKPLNIPVFNCGIIDNDF